MCCLFGILDYGHSLKPSQMRKLLTKLSIACEVRGTDATGIAYNYAGELKIYKRPLPARFMHFRVPQDVRCVMGHTRMTTQGDEKRNCNNHPFLGQADVPFALAHNGILYNDKELREKKKLPATKIETDSYIAVQLLEQSGKLSLSTLADMAETVSGSFAFTLLDRSDNFYVVRGSNPFCLYYFERHNLYVYASTEEILREALRDARLDLGEYRHISLINGDLLHIDSHGSRTFARFTPETYANVWHFRPYSSPWAGNSSASQHNRGSASGQGSSASHGSFAEQSFAGRSSSASSCGSPASSDYDYEPTFFDLEYVNEIKAVAGAFGYSPDYIDLLLDDGFTPEEVEELLYEGKL